MVQSFELQRFVATSWLKSRDATATISRSDNWIDFRGLSTASGLYALPIRRFAWIWITDKLTRELSSTWANHPPRYKPTYVGGWRYQSMTAVWINERTCEHRYAHPALIKGLHDSWTLRARIIIYYAAALMHCAVQKPDRRHISMQSSKALGSTVIYNSQDHHAPQYKWIDAAFAINVWLRQFRNRMTDVDCWRRKKLPNSFRVLSSFKIYKL